MTGPTPTSSDNIDVRVRLRDELTADARLITRALEDIERAARLARTELDQLQHQITRVGRAAALTAVDMQRLNAQIQQQERAVIRLTAAYRLLHTQMRNHASVQQTVNRNTNTGTSRTEKFGKALKKVRSTLMTFGKGALYAAGGVLAFAAAMKVAAGAQGILAAIPALTSVLSLAAFIPTALGSVIAVAGTAKLAFSGMGEGIKAAMSGDWDGLSKAMEKMGPNARKFLQVIAEMSPQFKKLRKDIQESVFLPISKQIKPLLQSIFPILSSGMRLVAKELGDFISNFMQFFRTVQGKNLISAMFVGGADLLAGLNKGFAPLLKGIADMMVMVAPMWAKFTGAVGDTMMMLGDWISAISSDGRLQGWIDTAVNTLKTLFGIVVDLFNILARLFQIMGESGSTMQGLLKVLDGVLEWMDTLEGRNALSTFFASIVTLAQQLTPLLTSVLTIIGKIVAPQLLDILLGLVPGVQAIVDALGQGLAELAPIWGPLATAISQVVMALAPLLPVVGKVIVVLAQILVPIIRVLATVLDPVIRAFSTFANIFLDAFSKALTERGPMIEQIITALSTAFEKMAPIVSQLAQMLSDELAKVLPQILDVGMKMLPVILRLVDLFGTFLVGALNQLMPFMPDLLDAFFQFYLALVQLAPAFIPILEALAQLFEDFIIPNLPVLTFLIKIMIELAVVFLSAGMVVLKVAGWIIEYLGKALVWLTGEWVKAYDLIKKPVEAAFNWIVDHVGHVLDAIKGLLSSIQSAINLAQKIPVIGDLIPGRWMGGPVDVGVRYQTGELGPEMFIDRMGRKMMLGEYGPEKRTFDTPGVVIPNHMLGAMDGIEDSIRKQHASLRDSSRQDMAGVVARKEAPVVVEKGDTYNVTTNFHGAEGADTKKIERTIRRTLKKVQQEAKERR